MRREAARLHKDADQRIPPKERSWFDILPPDVQRQVRLVEAEMDELVARAGPPPEGVHPLHWKGWVLMKSKKGLNLFMRMGDLFSAHPPTPPAEVPVVDDLDDRLPAGCLPGWEQSPPSPAGDKSAEAQPAEVPPLKPPAAPSPAPFVLPPPEPPLALSVKGVVERLIGFLGPGWMLSPEGTAPVKGINEPAPPTFTSKPPTE
jgi:hypothetical protein